MNQAKGIILAFAVVASGHLSAQVGINTDTPAANVELHVAADFEAIRLDGNSPFISFYDGPTYRGYLYMTGNNMFLYNRMPGNINFGTSNSNRMSIISDGSVGIGTTIPEARLHVANGTLTGDFNNNTIAGFEKSSGNGYISVKTQSSSESGMLFADETSSVKGGIIYNNTSTPDGLIFRTNGNLTRMSIDDVGDVGIGITNANRPLHVKSRNGGDEYGIKLERSGSTTNWEMSVFQGNFCFFYNGAVTPTASINTSGTYQSSDRRLKENIRPCGEVLPLVDKLQVSRYQYRDDEAHKEVVGLIAQDVQELFPEIVVEMPARGASETTYAVDYSKLGVISIKAVQEMRNEVRSLRQQNEQLLQRLEALEQAR